MTKKCFGRMLNQDDWKRSQIRMPQELYEKLCDFAQDKDLSLNSAMIYCLQKQLESDENNPFMQTLQSVQKDVAIICKYIQAIYGGELPDNLLSGDKHGN